MKCFSGLLTIFINRMLWLDDTWQVVSDSRLTSDWNFEWKFHMTTNMVGVVGTH
jgi:hypothetical protein